MKVKFSNHIFIEDAKKGIDKNFQLNKNIMSKLSNILILISFSLLFIGCEFIGDIFKAGVWVGIIVIIAIIAVIAFLIKLFRG